MYAWRLMRTLAKLLLIDFDIGSSMITFQVTSNSNKKIMITIRD